MAKCTFQSGAGSPVGVAVPKFIGQLYHDTVADTYYRSTGLTNADWTLISGAAAPLVVWSPTTEIATWTDSGGAGQVGDYPTFLANADLNTLSDLSLDGTAITKLLVCNCTSIININASNCTGPLGIIEVAFCPLLDSLVCFSGGVGTFAVIQCPSMTNLNCSTNQIRAFDFSECPGLITLNCSFNNASSLDFSSLTSLQTVNCSGMDVATLDFTSCTPLVNLACSNNNILTNLNLTGLINLQNIVCSYTNIAAVDLSTLSGLISFVANFDPLLAGLDFTGCPAIQTIDCSQNIFLSTVNVTGCVSLLTVIASNCGSLVSLDFSTCASLNSLSCTYCALTSLNVLGCTVLSAVIARYNSLANGAGGGVNVLLSDMVTNNPPVGSIAIESQTPAAPPDAGPPDGATAKATLIGLGWIVTTD